MTEFSFTRADFPKGFLFGAATSAYQIEGHAFGGADLSEWASFAATPGNVRGAQNGARACAHYHRFEEDLDLVTGAGLDAYRFSTSWARVMPDGVTLNPQGLDFYDRLSDAILARGLKPMLTLYHWELPRAMADIGGWRNRVVAERFAVFAETVARRIADRMFSTATVCEPWCISWLSHFMGIHAPGLRDIRASTRAMHHVGLGHGLATSALRALGVGNLGVVVNFEHALPADDSAAAAAAAHLYDGIYNRWFVGGFCQGRYPQDVLEALAPHMPERWEADMATISAPIDWLGINYYTCKRIAPLEGAAWPALTEMPGPLPKTMMEWEIHPQGLHHFLTWIAHTYTGDLPLYVTESGMANPDTPEGPDTARIAYLDAHLKQARRAIGEGVPLKGYVIWSLLDNYEWSFGYDRRFGLVHVDFDTLARRPKASWYALGRALRAGAG